MATASLELGIDIGDVDLVIQVGATRSIATFLQRVGRSGHALRKIPKGRLFPLTLDELVEGAALLRCVRGAVLDVFPTGSVQPIRIDLFDDEIEKRNAVATPGRPGLDPGRQRDRVRAAHGRPQHRLRGAG